MSFLLPIRAASGYAGTGKRVVSERPISSNELVSSGKVVSDSNHAFPSVVYAIPVRACSESASDYSGAPQNYSELACGVYLEPPRITYACPRSGTYNKLHTTYVKSVRSVPYSAQPHGYAEIVRSTSPERPSIVAGLLHGRNYSDFLHARTGNLECLRTYAEPICSTDAAPLMTYPAEPLGCRSNLNYLEVVSTHVDSLCSTSSEPFTSYAVPVGSDSYSEPIQAHAEPLDSTYAGHFRSTSYAEVDRTFAEPYSRNESFSFHAESHSDSNVELLRTT